MPEIMRNDLQRLTTTHEPDRGIGVRAETLQEKSIYMVAAYRFQKGRVLSTQDRRGKGVSPWVDDMRGRLFSCDLMSPLR